MTASKLLGATEVIDGSGAVIATSRQGNFEAGGIDLDFVNAAAMAGIQRGANYTLRDAGGNTFRCIAVTPDPPTIYHFAVAS